MFTPPSLSCFLSDFVQTSSKGILRHAWLCAALLGLFAGKSAAATLNYDNDGDNANGITDGNTSGWNTTASNKPWYDSISGTFVAWPNTNADIAVFGGGSSGTAGNITVGTVTANGMTFNAPFAGTYALNGGTITLDGVAPTITTNTDIQINSKMLATSLIKEGTNKLVVNNTGNSLGAVTVNAGLFDVFLKLVTTDFVVGTNGRFDTHSGTTWSMDSLSYNGTANSQFGAYSTSSNYTIGAGGLSMSAGTINVITGTIDTITTKLTLQGNINVTGTGTTTLGSSGSGTELLDLDGGVRTATVATGKTFVLNVPTQNGGLQKEGAGTMQISSANTYALNTVVNAGTLKMSGAGTLGDTTNDLTVATGATLDLGGTSQTVDVLDGAGTVTNTSTTTGTLTIGNNGGSGTFNGTITGTSSNKVAIIKTGAGSQTFTGASTYSGGTTLEGGTLIALDTTVYGTASQVKKAFGTGTLTLNGGVLQVRANGTGSTDAETLAFNNNTVIGGDVSISIARESGSGTTKTVRFGSLTMGAQTLSVNAPNGYVLEYNVESTLTGNAVMDVQTGTLNLNKGITGAYSITKNGTGRLTIRGGSFGDFNINAGIGDIYANTTSKNVTISGTGIMDTHSGTTWTMDSLTYDSTASSGFSSFSSNSVYTIGTGGLSMSTNATITVLAQSLGITNKVVLKGDATITGNSSIVINTAASTLGTMLFDLDGGTRSFDVASGKTFTLSIPTQNGGITKTGDGTMNLTLANTYAGNTTIQAGTFKLSGSGGIDSSAVISVGTGAFFDVASLPSYTVQNTQKLEGGGTVTGSVTADTGSILAPGTTGGDEVQALTISGDLTLVSGSKIILQLSNLDGNDVLNITGDFIQDTGAQIVVEAGDFVPTSGQSFDLLDWGNLLAVSFNLGPDMRDGSADDVTDLNLPDISGSGLFWDVSQFTTNGIIFVVPEPSRFTLLMLSGMVLIWRRRRS